MENETSPEKNSWLSDISWRATIIYVALSVIGGGATGAGVIATKAVAAQGISQDQADVRYLTKDEAARRSDARDKQQEEIKRDMVKEKVFDERTNMILRELNLVREQQRQDREYFERLLMNQNR